MTNSNTEPKQDFVFAEYQEFVGTSPEGMERYLLKAIALPDRTERFNWEEYEEDSPLLVKVRAWGPIWRSQLIKNGLVMVGIGVVFAVVLTLLGVEDAIARAAFATVTLIAATALGGAIGLSIYKRNVRLVESDTLRDAVFARQLQKWALARYDFNSAEDFLATLRGKDGLRCYLAEGGSLSGLVVSSVTGEEWPLKPNLKETS